jgi:hypothetical protein
MFKDWDSFFLLIGSAAGALIGLLFVVATLNNRVERSKALKGTMLYMTPIVFHFAMVVVVSGVVMAPNLGEGALGIAIGVAALVGLVHGAVITRLFFVVRTPGQAHWSDIWFYAVGPTVVYAALAGAAASIWRGAAFAPEALGAVLMTLLLLCIRNAWDLVTWLAPKPDSE